MKNENNFKTIFIKSIKYNKGFATKIAAPTINGLPDMYVIYPGFMPILLEAKWLGELKNKNFSRLIPFKDLQYYFLEETNRIQFNSSMGLIGFKFEGKIYAVLTSYPCRQINSGFRCIWPYTTYDPSQKRFDVQYLFNHSDIPRMLHPKFTKDLSSLLSSLNSDILKDTANNIVDGTNNDPMAIRE